MARVALRESHLTFRAVGLTWTLFLCCLVPFLSLVPGVNGYGYVHWVDVSTSVSTDQFQCLSSQGVSGVVVRAWRSLGDFDKNAPATVASAHQAGIPNVDVYMFPCIKCGNFEDQVSGLLSGLNETAFDRVWLDVEGVQYWTGDCGQNLKDFEDLMSILISSLGKERVGVYCSPTSWHNLMCDVYTPVSADVPLWYPHYDKNPSFSDFPQDGYGGWHRPLMKQYVGSTTAFCNAGVDLNVMWNDTAIA